VSILDQIRYKCNEHSRRAIAEGRGYESHFLALLMEILEMNFGDLQGKANALLDKLSQLEADTRDLVAKSGGTASQNPSAPADGSVVLNPDQLNSFAAVLDQIGTRIEALKDEVVHGTAKIDSPPSSPPPSDGTAPIPSPAGPSNPNPETNRNPPTPTPTPNVGVAPIDNPTPPPPTSPPTGPQGMTPVDAPSLPGGGPITPGPGPVTSERMENPPTAPAPNAT